MSYASKVGQQGQAKARYIQTKVGKKRVQAPIANQPTKQHMDNVWRFRLKGPGTYTFPTANIGHHLLQENLIPSVTMGGGSILSTGQPSWEVCCLHPRGKYSIRHGKEFQVEFIKGQKGFIRIEDVSIKDNRVIITNVAPTTSSSWMEQMLTDAGLTPLELQNKRRRDMWQFYTDTPIDEIPHYLEVDGDLCQTLSVQVPGRLIECYCRNTERE